MNSDPKKPGIILVLGMHRSGTSLAAQLIAKWGAYMGDQLMPPGKDNKDGYWEHLPLVHFHERLFNYSNNSWWSLPNDIHTAELIAEFGEEARQLVREMDQNGSTWCWKDPRMPVFLEFWEQILAGRDISYVIPFRHPSSVALSLQKRDNLPVLVSLELWANTSVCLFKALAGKEKYLLLDYDELLSEPTKVCLQLFDFLNVSLAVIRKDEIFRHMTGSVKKELYSSGLKSCISLSPLHKEILNVYRSGKIPGSLELDENQAWYRKQLFSLVKKISFAGNDRYFSQIYFLTPGNESFKEADSLIIPVSETSRELSFRFPKPLPVFRLRFDPINDYAGVRIQEVQLLLNGNRIDVPFSLTSNAMHEEEGLYLFDTRDAQVFIDFMPQQAVEADELFVRLEYKQIGADVFERLLRYKDEFIRRASGPDQQLAAKMAEVRLEMENLRLSVYRKDQLISAKEEELEDMRHKLREKVQDLQLILQSRSYKISRLMSLAFSMILPGKFRVMNRKIRYFITGTSLLKKSGWFDEDYYLKNNPDIRVKGRLAIWHYLVHGGFEGRRPCEGFDSAYYLRSNPDVLYGNMNPLLHFVLYGEKEKRLPEAINAGTAYADWIEQFDTVSETDREEMRKAIAAFPVKPLISVVMPVYDPKPEWLKEAIDSVIGQTYPSWELCIADDCSKNPLIHKILKEYREKEPRIKVAFRETNGHISAASNSALELVTGDYIALLDHDDKLPVQALYWVARTINDHPQAKLIYSDEDKIDSGGSRLMPYFKCDWNPELFYAQNLVSHLGVFKTEIVKEIGGFRTGYEGSQDYDLTLRFIEKAQREEIVHIPRVLYHWRMHENSVAQNPGSKAYAYTAAVKSINDHLSRIKSPARVEQQNIGSYRLMYPVPASNPLVSIIIPTRNQFSLLRTCIESILSKTAYPNYEVIIIDNNSDEPDTLQYLSGIERDSHLRCLKYQLPFNFSAITNFGVAAARGEFICLMNDDIEVIHSDWLAEMLGNACQPGIGAVGARLFYPNHTIQHAGVILGINGVAAHAFKCYPYDSHGYFGRLIATQELSAVTAACMLFRKSAFEQVGGFNEKELTIAFNDIDFCLKLKEAGYRNIYTPFARFYHHESASRGAEDTDEKKLRFSDETDYMRERWGTLLDQDPAYNPNLTLVYEDFSLAWPPRGVQKY